MKCSEPTCKLSATHVPYIAFFATMDSAPGFELNLEKLEVCQKHVRGGGTFEEFFDSKSAEDWKKECRRIFTEIVKQQKGNVTLDEDRLGIEFKKIKRR